MLDKTLTETIKILDKVSGKLNLLVCSGYNPSPTHKSPSHKSPLPTDSHKSPSHKLPSVHPFSNGDVMTDKAAIVNRKKSTEKDTRHFNAHNSHLLNGNWCESVYVIVCLLWKCCFCVIECYNIIKRLCCGVLLKIIFSWFLEVAKIQSH